VQITSRNRHWNRAILLAAVAALIIIASWQFSSSNHPASAWASPNFAWDTSAGPGASADVQIQNLQKRLRIDSNDWQAYSQLGLVYLQKARESGDPVYYQKAEKALDQALSFQPDDYASIGAKGALALARHQFHQALELGKQARQINPDRAYAYGVIADAQIELGQYSEAVETLQAMVDLRPDMSSYSRISYIRELHGDTAGALEMMQRAVDSGTPNSESTAWSRTQLATLYFNTGDLEQAEVEYERTLQDRPNYVYAIAGLGRVRAAQGDADDAIKLLTQAVGIMPMPDFVITLGDLYQTTGQQAAALQQYKLVTTIEQLYRANGVDLDMEIALFNADHDQNLAATLELARQAYENRPSIQGADALAWVLYKNGDYQEAQKYSEAALQLGTQDALKLFHAGMIAVKLGRHAEATQYLKEALAINPHFSILHADEAQMTLQTLQQAANQ
jgi:tetratricopeptide (TPR) repeat protein